jgi:hypothetical protein
MICSDNAAFDAYWLGMLTELIGQPPFEVKDFDRLRAAELRRLGQANAAAAQHAGLQTMLEQGRQYIAAVDAHEATRQRTVHRALSDADSLWRRWYAVKIWVDRQLKLVS